MMNLWVFWYLSFVCVLCTRVFGNVVLIGKNVTLSFEDIEANFGELKILTFALLLPTIDLCFNFDLSCN